MSSSVNDVRLKRLAILISGNGSNLQAIIEAIQNQQLSAEIAVVVSNQPNAHGLQRARDAGLPTKLLKHQDYSNRVDYDQALINTIDHYQADLIIMAGFMRILGESFIDRYKNRIMNIHPSLLPKYKGLNTHAKAIAGGDSIHGASVHFVTNQLDAGPVIIQGIVPIHQNDTAERLQQRVHRIEHRIYPTAVKWFVEDRLTIKDKKVLLDNQQHSDQQLHINA